MSFVWQQIEVFIMHINTCSALLCYVMEFFFFFRNCTERGIVPLKPENLFFFFFDSGFWHPLSRGRVLLNAFWSRCSSRLRSVLHHWKWHNAGSTAKDCQLNETLLSPGAGYSFVISMAHSNFSFHSLFLARANFSDQIVFPFSSAAVHSRWRSY